MTARIDLPHGSLALEELLAICSVLPADVTFVDAKGIVRYFSEYRIFDRPASCLGRDVLDCHSPATRPGIARMLSEFASGWRDESYFLAEKNGKQVHVRYLPVHDPEQGYLGCLEFCTWGDSSVG